MSTKPLIAVVGETASGKSGLAMEIARRFNGEIIAADSRTIYRGMDIGTAKPSRADQEEIPHHMLDTIDPDQIFTAAEFQAKANEIINDIYVRGKLPVIVGGTGLYVDSVLFDYSFNEKGDENERQKLENMHIDELQSYAAEHQIELDHEAVKNKRYLIRMIETRGLKNNDRGHMRTNTLVLGLKLERSKIRKRIEQRVESMFRSGLRTEVDTLQHKYGWDHEALSGIGYREFRAFYENEASMSKVKRDVVQNTLKYAKRQRTWFKRNPAIQWFKEPEDALKAAQVFLEDKESK